MIFSLQSRNRNFHNWHENLLHSETLQMFPFSSFSSGPRHFSSHGIWCWNGQVQEPHHASPVMKMAQKWHQETSRFTKIWISLGVDPKFLRNICFDKNHKKGLERMQANNTKVMSAHAHTVKGLINLKEVKPKIPTVCSHKLNWLAYIAHPKLRKCAHAHTAKGLRLCWTNAKVKAQTKAQAVASNPISSPSLVWLRFPKYPRPPQSLQHRSCHLPMWGQKDWCNP